MWLDIPQLWTVSCGSQINCSLGELHVLTIMVHWTRFKVPQKSLAINHIDGYWQLLSLSMDKTVFSQSEESHWVLANSFPPSIFPQCPGQGWVLEDASIFLQLALFASGCLNDSERHWLRSLSNGMYSWCSYRNRTSFPQVSLAPLP